jgi:hypothetical protein
MVVLSLMGPFPVVMGEVLLQDVTELPLSEKDEPVEAFVLHGAHPPLGVGVEVGGRGGKQKASDPGPPDHPSESASGELPVSVVDEKFAVLEEAVFIEGGVAGDLADPFVFGMGGYASQVNPSGRKLDEEEDVEGGKTEAGPDLSGEEVAGPEDVFVGLDELPPGVSHAFFPGRDPVPLEEVGDGLMADGVAQDLQGSLDGAVAPGGILRSQLEDEVLDFPIGRRPTNLLPVPSAEIVLLGDEFAVPSQEGVGGDDVCDLPEGA